ncbi:MAG: hypothetical protein HRU70_01620 [Phycisphaeraceae bacterium]|nr:MAG: hypothetical protein HRU70_01620 [Phycisphaeraceae bacterium]
MKKSGWIVTLSGEVAANVVAQKLADEGFDVKDVLDEIGSVTGSATPDAVKRLRKIKGVADIAPDAPIQLDPPDHGPTW